MTKKTAILILLTTAIVAILFVSYLIFFPKTKTLGDKNTNGTSEETEFGFPTNNAVGNNNNDNTASGDNETTEDVSLLPKLRQISSSPISGYTTTDKEIETGSGTTTETIYRYIDRATGNLYESTSMSSSAKRITNTTIPKIYNSLFFDNGSGVILQYLDDNENIETFVTRVSTTTSDVSRQENFSSLVGTFLPLGVDSITKSSSDNKFFYTIDGKGYVFDANSPQKQTIILDSQITEWLSDWSSQTILLTTKPSASSEGFVFTQNPSGGDLVINVDNRHGLLVLPNHISTNILISEFKDGSLSTTIYNTENNSIGTLKIKTLADKCVWSKKDVNILYCAVPDNLVAGQYPDIWYQGIVSFNDSLYKINLSTNAQEKFTGIESVFDMTNLALSENEQFLTFINKKDLQLWSLDISN